MAQELAALFIQKQKKHGFQRAFSLPELYMNGKSYSETEVTKLLWNVKLNQLKLNHIWTKTKP